MYNKYSNNVWDNANRKEYGIKTYNAVRTSNKPKANQLRNESFKNKIYNEISTIDIPKKVIWMTVGKNGINFKTHTCS